MESDIVENEDGPGPYGSKGMSEGALLCVAPAVAAAVRDATGVVIRDLPLTPERVWRALNEASARRPTPAREPTPPDDLRLRPRRRRQPRTLAEAKALVGGKAANLGVMARELGLPVPPGFVITTATCRTFLASGWPAGLDDELRARMAEVEAAVGRRFGDPADPLLVSVRSGAPGLDARDDGHDPEPRPERRDDRRPGACRRAATAFARSCRERFEASFRVDRRRRDVPEDPWLQLRLAIEAVFRSWNSDRARAYRRKEGIPDDLGTAVTVQAMVFGNRGADLGDRRPLHAQPGDRRADPLRRRDVRRPGRGRRRRAPIGPSRSPSSTSGCRRSPPSCATTPTRLERHYADLCDIEFTIEEGRLWMLQVRVGKRSPQAALRIAVDMAEDETFPLSRAEAVERVAAAARPSADDRRAPGAASSCRSRPACRRRRGWPAARS